MTNPYSILFGIICHESSILSWSPGNDTKNNWFFIRKTDLYSNLTCSCHFPFDRASFLKVLLRFSLLLFFSFFLLSHTRHDFIWLSSELQLSMERKLSHLRYKSQLSTSLSAFHFPFFLTSSLTNRFSLSVAKYRDALLTKTARLKSEVRLSEADLVDDDQNKKKIRIFWIISFTVMSSPSYAWITYDGIPSRLTISSIVVLCQSPEMSPSPRSALQSS